MNNRYTKNRQSQLNKSRNKDLHSLNRVIQIQSEKNKIHEYHILPISTIVSPNTVRDGFSVLRKSNQPVESQRCNTNKYSNAVKRK